MPGPVATAAYGMFATMFVVGVALLLYSLAIQPAHMLGLTDRTDHPEPARAVGFTAWVVLILFPMFYFIGTLTIQILQSLF